MATWKATNLSGGPWYQLVAPGGEIIKRLYHSEVLAELNTNNNAAEALVVAVDNLTVVKVRAGRLMDEGDNSWLTQNLYSVASEALAQIAKLQATDSRSREDIDRVVESKLSGLINRLTLSEQALVAYKAAVAGDLLCSKCGMDLYAVHHSPGQDHAFRFEALISGLSEGG